MVAVVPVRLVVPVAATVGRLPSKGPQRVSHGLPRMGLEETRRLHPLTDPAVPARAGTGSRGARGDGLRARGTGHGGGTGDGVGESRVGSVKGSRRVVGRRDHERSAKRRARPDGKDALCDDPARHQRGHSNRKQDGQADGHEAGSRLGAHDILGIGR